MPIREVPAGNTGCLRSHKNLSVEGVGIDSISGEVVFSKGLRKLICSACGKKKREQRVGAYPKVAEGVCIILGHKSATSVMLCVILHRFRGKGK